METYCGISYGEWKGHEKTLAKQNTSIEPWQSLSRLGAFPEVFSGSFGS